MFVILNHCRGELSTAQSARHDIHIPTLDVLTGWLKKGYLDFASLPEKEVTETPSREMCALIISDACCATTGFDAAMAYTNEQKAELFGRIRC